MTESEWLTTSDLAEIGFHLKGLGAPRKLRLAVCGCVRLVWDQLTDVRSRQAVEVSERFADGRCSRKDLHRACINAKVATSIAQWTHAYASPECNRVRAADSTALKDSDSPWGIAWTGGLVASTATGDEEKQRLTNAQADLVRCVFGNPFQPVTFLPEWRTSTVLALSQQMYDTRDFSAMPILADALQDAGCSVEAILKHCREPGRHVRGCWVIDAALNRACCTPGKVRG